jgi:hypothetical protein
VGGEQGKGKRDPIYFVFLSDQVWACLNVVGNNTENQTGLGRSSEMTEAM